MSDVLRFLEGNGVDHAKRSLDFIIKQNDYFWEDQHDFIQWVFPLNEKSMAVPNSPVIRPDEITAIIKSHEAQSALITSTKRFKRFLHNSFDWRYYSDHNHLRITRVIKSLRLLGPEGSADAFKNWVYLELDEDIARISEKTQMFWKDN